MFLEVVNIRSLCELTKNGTNPERLLCYTCEVRVRILWEVLSTTVESILKNCDLLKNHWLKKQLLVAHEAHVLTASHLIKESDVPVKEVQEILSYVELLEALTAIDDSLLPLTADRSEGFEDLTEKLRSAKTTLNLLLLQKVHGKYSIGEKERLVYHLRKDPAYSLGIEGVLIPYMERVAQRNNADLSIFMDA